MEDARPPTEDELKKKADFIAQQQENLRKQQEELMRMQNNSMLTQQNQKIKQDRLPEGAVWKKAAAQDLYLWNNKAKNLGLISATCMIVIAIAGNFGYVWGVAAAIISFAAALGLTMNHIRYMNDINERYDLGFKKLEFKIRDDKKETMEKQE